MDAHFSTYKDVEMVDQDRLADSCVNDSFQFSNWLNGHGKNRFLAIRNCFLILLFLTPSAHASHWSSSDYILASFNKIAVKNSQVNKWQGPIYYQIIHHVDDIELHDDLVATHLKQLQQITGLHISPADDRHKVNFTIVLTTENNLKSDVGRYFNIRSDNEVNVLTNNKIGVTSLLTDKRGYIKRSVVVIPTDRARAYGKLLTSFSEMLTKGLGLQNRAVDVTPSVFNAYTVDEFLTGLDYVMLKLLYDKRIKPTMNYKQIQQVSSSILSERHYQHHISGAEMAVKTSGLYTMIN